MDRKSEVEAKISKKLSERLDLLRDSSGPQSYQILNYSFIETKTKTYINKLLRFKIRKYLYQKTKAHKSSFNDSDSSTKQLLDSATAISVTKTEVRG